MRNKIKTIAFDADDTLWVNETYFQEAEQRFCALLEDHLPAPTVIQELFDTEMKNLALYGYGIKSVMLSMVETVTRLTEGKASTHLIKKIIEMGQELMHRPVELLPGVEETLDKLQGERQVMFFSMLICVGTIYRDRHAEKGFFKLREECIMIFPVPAGYIDGCSHNQSRC